MKLYDSARYLENDAMIVRYIKVAVQTEEKEQMLNSLSNAMRARVINQLANRTGIEREKIFRLFMGSVDVLGYPEISQEAILNLCNAFIEDCLKSQAHHGQNHPTLSRWRRHPALWFLVGVVLAILIPFLLQNCVPQS